MRATTAVRWILSAWLLMEAAWAAGWAVGLLLLLLVVNAEAQRELCRRRDAIIRASLLAGLQ